MSKHIPSILITGFGPFPGAPDNPSQLLVKALAERENSPSAINANLVYGLLPTHWQKLAHALTQLLEHHQPDLCVHLGYSAHSCGFCLETTAYNETCAQPDVDGHTGSCDPVLGEQPLQLTSNFPLEMIEQELSAAGFNAMISNDPGRYLCNKSYYLSLTRSRSSLFVHIPALKTDAGFIPANHDGKHQLSLQNACDGVRLIASILTKP
ncbi:MAG: pyroglutamyl-peptidase I [bacterium]|nr:pyroglutamyl-peptidase I [bacterium]